MKTFCTALRVYFYKYMQNALLYMRYTLDLTLVGMNSTHSHCLSCALLTQPLNVVHTFDSCIPCIVSCHSRCRLTIKQSQILKNSLSLLRHINVIGC